MGWGAHFVPVGNTELGRLVERLRSFVWFGVRLGLGRRFQGLYFALVPTSQRLRVQFGRRGSIIPASTFPALDAATLCGATNACQS